MSLSLAMGRGSGRLEGFHLTDNLPIRSGLPRSYMKHFLKDTDFTVNEIPKIFALARTLKEQRGKSASAALNGQTWALIFSKSSTRTRVSFEVGIHELGGKPLFLNQNDIQLGRGESISDTARVLSRYVHGLVVRTYDHADVEALAATGGVPVINALTDFLHPCQIYADAFTLAERWSAGSGDYLSSLSGRKVAFLGDCACNVANSWILGANLMGMEVALAGPKNYAPGEGIRALLKEEGFGDQPYTFTEDPMEAVKDADVVYTDVWVSMGKEDEMRDRIADLMPYGVTMELMNAAKPDAFFMHCLPAYVSKEVTLDVLESPRSIVFDQAENRLHIQKAILSLLGR